MIHHVSIGVRDLGRARRFYDAAFAPLGFRLLNDFGSTVGYGAENARFWVSAVPKPIPADPESGLHLCFDAKDRAAVDSFHAAAVKAGGKDNGKPGLRADYGPNYYAAFVVDPDGYRIEAYYGKAP
jgi:catechol 2,3-dioxygenase-like lactoylglutathione lyase family enzyme